MILALALAAAVVGAPAKPEVCIFYDTVKAEPVVILLTKDESRCDSMHDNDGPEPGFIAEIRLPMSMFHGDPDSWDGELRMTKEVQAVFEALEGKGK